MRWVVVGAGSAGCVVAARLCEQEQHEVTLLEAGPDRTSSDRPTALRSRNALRAAEEAEAWWTGQHVTRTFGGGATTYLRGRGVGGSGAVNGMLALPGLPRDHDRWVSLFGCRGWGWADVADWYSRVRALTRQIPPDELTPLDQLLLAAARELGLPDDVDLGAPGDGAGRLWVTADDVARRSSAELWLDTARRRANLRVLGDATVDRVLLDGRRAVGVLLVDGTHLEADHVVLCAGAIGSPAILLRSGVRRRGIGRNLRDHAYGGVSLQLAPDMASRGWTGHVIGTGLRVSSRHDRDDLQLLPVYVDPAAPSGRLLLVLLRCRSTGRLALDEVDPLSPPTIDLQLLSNATDRAAMRDGIGLLVAVLRSTAFAGLVEAVSVDGVGGAPEDLLDPDVADVWLRHQPGDVAHACGTCRMGDPSDPDAVVDPAGTVIGYPNLHVVDASVFPDVPSAGPYLPTLMLAERLSHELLAQHG